MDARRPTVFKGQGFSLKGDKNRFVLPAAFRQSMRDASYGAKTVCLTKHDRFTCLTAFGQARVDEFQSKLERQQDVHGKDFDWDMMAQQLYGCDEVPFDDSGRFVIPEHLLRIAKVTDQLYFRSAGDFILMWAPDELAKAGEGWESAQAACADFVAGVGKKGGKT
jgi:MraZ protein